MPANGDVRFYSASGWRGLSQGEQQAYAWQFGNAALSELNAHKGDESVYLHEGVFLMADTWSVLKGWGHLSKSAYLQYADGVWAHSLQAFWKYKSGNQEGIAAARKVLQQAQDQFVNDLKNNLGPEIGGYMVIAVAACGLGIVFSWVTDGMSLSTCVAESFLSPVAISALAITLTVKEHDLYLADVQRVQDAGSALGTAIEEGKKTSVRYQECTSTAIRYAGCYLSSQDLSGKDWAAEWNRKS